MSAVLVSSPLPTGPPMTMARSFNHSGCTFVPEKRTGFSAAWASAALSRTPGGLTWTMEKPWTTNGEGWRRSSVRGSAPGFYDLGRHDRHRVGQLEVDCLLWIVPSSPLLTTSAGEQCPLRTTRSPSVVMNGTGPCRIQYKLKSSAIALLVHQGHGGQFVFHYSRKKTFVIGVGPSCDLVINTAVPYNTFKRTRFCMLERRGKSTETYIKIPDGVPVQVNGRVPAADKFHMLPSGAQLTFPTTSEDSPVKGCISFQYWNITPGSVFDVFRLQDCIGQGGFGTVFDAVHKDSRAKYAIKIVRKPRQLPQRGGEDPVDREIGILTEISHPSVVELYDVFVQGHTYFLAMELMPKGSLQDLLKQERRIVDSDAKLVTLDVCAALAYLHAKGIVHRDIKPGNILVFSRNPLSVKVADFGIAKDDRSRDTMCGTPDFMAPEISRQERYDCKVDTWALGVTLFIMWVTFRHLRSDADPEIFS
ncbi:kinase-like domain-containing protein [Ganoderma leucocontextum]|nr:kinase-like domain-containing protein [Ganoderma leucocontextum]